MERARYCCNECWNTGTPKREMRNRVDEAIQYALAGSEPDCFTIGAECVAELQDLIRRIHEAIVRA